MLRNVHESSSRKAFDEQREQDELRRRMRVPISIQHVSMCTYLSEGSYTHITLAS